MSDISDLITALTLRGEHDLAKQIEGLGHVEFHARHMLQDGKITAGEKREIEAHLVSEMMKVLPMDAFVEMRKDGRWEMLGQLTSHDGTRSSYDVDRQRRGLVGLVMRDGLTSLWEAGLMDDDEYKANSQNLGLPEELKEAITDKGENSAFDVYIFNKFGDEDFRHYHEGVKQAEAPAEVSEDDMEVSEEDAREFRNRYAGLNTERDEAPSDQSDIEAAPAEESRAV
jgi:hypothetical protein